MWLKTSEELPTGPESRLFKACLHEGMLYVPGQFCYVPDEQGGLPDHEARLCYGIATLEQIGEAIHRLGRAARAAALPPIKLPRVAACRA